MNVPPFPQANNIELMLSIIMDFPDDGLVYSAVSKKNKITSRQGSYYLDALRFLNLTFKIGDRYFLSEAGNQVKSSSNNKNTFCNLIINNEKIKTLYNYFQENKDKNKEEKLNYFSSYIQVNYNLEIATARRRASSIFNWFLWINTNLREDEHDL